jgi:PhzF family phenazine biosynthesis protein
MSLRIFQIDAFSKTTFGGNPAAVIPLDSWLPDEVLQNIAMENNLSETAFFVSSDTGFHIRWFTPTVEVQLCGHATLATAHVLFEHFSYDSNNLIFDSKSGPLEVSRASDHYRMLFPSDNLKPVSTPIEILKALSIDSSTTFKGRDDYMVVVDSQHMIEQLRPDFKTLASLDDCRGVIVTAPGKDTDFVSRCFFPQSGVDEDPATGSAHTSMAPYWAKKLNKNKLSALQLSNRKGILHCEYLEDKTAISGYAKTYLVGEIYL